MNYFLRYSNHQKSGIQPQNTNIKSVLAKIKAYPNDRYFSTEYKLHSMYTKKIGKCISNRIKVQVICHGYLNIVCFIGRNTGFFGEIDRDRAA